MFAWKAKSYVIVFLLLLFSTTFPEKRGIWRKKYFTDRWTANVCCYKRTFLWSIFSEWVAAKGSFQKINLIHIATCPIQKAILKISQSIGVYSSTVLKTATQLFYCCKIFKDIYFEKYLRSVCLTDVNTFILSHCTGMIKIETYVMYPTYMEAMTTARFTFDYCVIQTDRLADH